MSSAVFPVKFKQRVKDGTFDFDTDTFKIALLNNNIDIVNARLNDTAYSVGDFYKQDDNYYYCVVDGTSNSSTPIMPTDLTAVVDGTATFQDVGTSQMNEYIAVYQRQNDDVLVTGQFYIPTTPNGHWYQTTTGGTAASSEPVYKTDGTTFTDGTATVQDMGLYSQRPKFSVTDDISVFSDVSSNEVSGTGYIAGGEALQNTSVINGVFDADDVEWLTSNITATWAVLYRLGTINTLTDPIVSMIRLSDTQVSSTNADFLIAWNAQGIIN